MKLININFEQLKEECVDGKIVAFGVGELFKNYGIDLLTRMGLDSCVAYAVDNSCSGETVNVSGRVVDIYSPDKLKDETEKCVVIIFNSLSVYDIYLQLRDMGLNDNIKVCPYVFMIAVSCGKADEELRNELYSRNCGAIKKEINTFWFSGDPIPEQYQVCMDSWKKYCPDYEIKIWTKDNYDYKKNEFLYEAIQARKWAFASDYARLDVIYNNGGIYMDSDYELIKPLDSILCNRGIFPYDFHNNIELMFFAAEKGNTLVKLLLDIYEDAIFDKGNVKKYVQPYFIKETLKKYGVNYDGNMQCIDGNYFLPRNFFNPFKFLFEEYSVIGEDSFGIHHSNMGWRPDGHTQRRCEQYNKMKEVILGR